MLFSRFSTIVERCFLRLKGHERARASESEKGKRKKYLIQSIIYKFCEESDKAKHFEINLFSHLDL